MRRKVLQDFANTLSQNYVDLTSMSDAVAFYHHGSGVFEMNLLTLECTFNSASILTLEGCEILRSWLFKQLEVKNIKVEDLLMAKMSADIAITRLIYRDSYGMRSYNGWYNLVCQSEIKTDEKIYTGYAKGESRCMVFASTYNTLYSQPPKLIDSSL